MQFQIYEMLIYLYPYNLYWKAAVYVHVDLGNYDIGVQISWTNVEHDGMEHDG